MLEQQTPQSLDEHMNAFMQGEIARSTQPLTDAIERGGLGAEGSHELGARVLEITTLIEQSPERVAADSVKPPQQRTEYDSDRAHLVALATRENMTRLAAYDRVNQNTKRHSPWQRAKVEQAALGAKLGEELVKKVYDADPLHSGPNMVELQRKQAQAAGNRDYKYVK